MRTLSTLTIALLLPLAACNKKTDATTDNPAPNPKATPTPAAPPAPPPPKAASGDDMAKRYVTCWGFLGTKNWDQFKTCYAPGATSDFMDSGMPTATGWDDILAMQTKPITDAFPDVKSDLELTLINGHNGVTVALLTGTHTGVLKTPAGDVPATKKKIGIQVAHAIHFADDAGLTVDKQWFYEDMGEMAGQLGLSKAPVRPAADKPMQDNEIVVAKDDDTEKKNLETVKAADAAFNKHDSKAMDALMADDLVWSEIGVPKDWNRKETAVSNDGLFKGFSDLKLDPSTSWAAGNYVVEQGVLSGTNDGPVAAMGLAKKTGKSLQLHYLQVWKLKDGKVTRSWGFWNSAAFAMQLGLVPPPKVPATK